LCCHSHACLGHDYCRARPPQLAAWEAQPEIRRQLSPLHLADVGILPEPWLLSVHERFHHPKPYAGRYRLGTGQFPAWSSGSKTTPGGHSPDAIAPVVCRRLCPGPLPGNANHDHRDGSAIRLYEPPRGHLVYEYELSLPGRGTLCLYRRPERLSSRTQIPEPAQFCSAPGYLSGASVARISPACSFRHLLHAG